MNIKIGDLVNVCYVAGPPVIAWVTHIPTSSGELWEFREQGINPSSDRIFAQNPYSTEFDRLDLVMSKKEEV